MQNIPKLYMSVCISLLLLFAYASAKGIVYSSMLTGNGTANKSATRYHK